VRGQVPCLEQHVVGRMDLALKDLGQRLHVLGGEVPEQGHALQALCGGAHVRVIPPAAPPGLPFRVILVL
jgi:hypothetical protein